MHGFVLPLARSVQTLPKKLSVTAGDRACPRVQHVLTRRLQRSRRIAVCALAPLPCTPGG